ncbi:MAG: hypothetical protein OXH19_05575 [Chloroflexi bacterium]|nr:hypothetical protein [Chloroflexota bacterium]MCY3589955.1 hypothetical protein [Chloroflexota bacterium]MCY3684604.1 hypothetical protein [Chloroflexota bacterium]MDE2710000.1 hypothetical protein [Chloroflexota bacterium]
MTENDDIALELEADVGHPGRLWEALAARVAADLDVQTFSAISAEWFNLMWCLDRYRSFGAAPIGMGNQEASIENRLSGIYRAKGNWFATILAQLLTNATGQEIRPRQEVQGFSQTHQIDIAWPAREDDPLVCAEAKVTGGPAYGSTRARGAMSDWSNRRKELKFAATDLKLGRRKHDTQIDSWGVWRRAAPPATYILWGARLRPDDRIERVTRQVERVVGTYLDGGGIVAWRTSSDGLGYEAVPLPPDAQSLSLDEALREIKTRINQQAAPGQPPPPPQIEP